MSPDPGVSVEAEDSFWHTAPHAPCESCGRDTLAGTWCDRCLVEQERFETRYEDGDW